MPRINVDPAEYVDAAQRFATANNGAVDVMTTLMNALGSCGGMAGSDSGGQQWAKVYDGQVRQLIDAGATIANGLGVAAQLLTASGSNHELADGDSTPGGGVAAGGFPGQSSGLDYYGGGGTGPAVETLTPAAPPSANGAGGDEPPGWFLVAPLLAYTFPNGQQDTLRRAAAAWQAAAEGLNAQADLLPAAIAAVNAQQSTETADAVARCKELQTATTQLAAGYQKIGTATSSCATQLDQTHLSIGDDLRSLMAMPGVPHSVSSIWDVLTDDLADVLNRLEQVVEHIAELIGELIDKIRMFVSEIIDAVAEVLGSLQAAIAFVVARAQAAAREIAQRLPGGAQVHRAGEAPFGTSKQSKGQLPPWLAERFRLGREFNQAQAHRYPYNEVHLANGKVLDSYTPGESIVSRKLTQLSEISESTAKQYILELVTKYPDGTLITPDTKNNSPIGGQRLDGVLVLEVPVQNAPIPQAVLDYAKLKGVEIHDVDGKPYR